MKNRELKCQYTAHQLQALEQASYYPDELWIPEEYLTFTDKDTLFVALGEFIKNEEPSAEENPEKFYEMMILEVSHLFGMEEEEAIEYITEFGNEKISRYGIDNLKDFT